MARHLHIHLHDTSEGAKKAWLTRMHGKGSSGEKTATGILPRAPGSAGTAEREIYHKEMAEHHAEELRSAKHPESQRAHQNALMAHGLAARAQGSDPARAERMSKEAVSHTRKTRLLGRG